MKEYDYHLSLFRGRLVQAAMVCSTEDRSCASCPKPFTEKDEWIMVHNNGKAYHLDCHFKGETWSNRDQKKRKSTKMEEYNG